MCYLILAISISFFLSSVCTYAVLAMTKQNNTKVKIIKKKSKNSQGKILKRLRNLEDRMDERKIKILNNRGLNE